MANSIMDASPARLIKWSFLVIFWPRFSDVKAASVIFIEKLFSKDQIKRFEWYCVEKNDCMRALNNIQTLENGRFFTLTQRARYFTWTYILKSCFFNRHGKLYSNFVLSIDALGDKLFFHGYDPVSNMAGNTNKRNY